MPRFTSGGVVYPGRADRPTREQWLERPARSIDNPEGLQVTGKIRSLAAAATQEIVHSFSFTSINTWGVAGQARSGTDQGDECGLLFTGAEFITTSEEGWYYVAASYSWRATSSSGSSPAIFIGDIDNPAGSNRAAQDFVSISGDLSAFDVLHCEGIVYLGAAHRLRVQVRQTTGSTIDGGVNPQQTSFTVAKLRMM